MTLTNRKRDLIWLAALLGTLILLFWKILFTSQIVRAPDIIAEFYWGVKHFKTMSFLDLFRPSMQAGWDYLSNGGGTEGGGTISLQFLFYRNLLFWLLPEPANTAWFMILHLFFGGAGVYCFCRAIGAGRLGSFLGGLIFAIAPENASLINAGHVQKIATISFAPWAFYFVEKAFQTRRYIFAMTAAVCLAFQFFNMHWQVAFYTCLGIGVYGVCRSAAIIYQERKEKGTLPRIMSLNAVILLFFLSTVAISLVPLSDWSKDTTRGVQSGSNQGKGGLDVEEAMSWSLPPEELVTFVIPGFFGYSRQEGGYNGTNIDAYYWGRMVFTQTTDYMGLLPWLLVPLPLIFRRDKYTWLATAGVVAGILFSMGKFTPFYWFLYEHFPGINRFRVPKMIMFLPVMGLGVLAARGIDLLIDEKVRATAAFRRYVYGVVALPVAVGALLGIETVARGSLMDAFSNMIGNPTRYEQGPELVARRWVNLVNETGIAMVVAAIHAAVIYWGGKNKKILAWLPVLLLVCYLGDVTRVNLKYLLLQPVPEQGRGVKTPAMEYVAKAGKEYRTLPMEGADPMSYVSNGIPVMFTSNPVQKKRWQDFLDNFNAMSGMADIMNVRYIVEAGEQYEKEKGVVGAKFTPVFNAPDGSVVLENRNVLPKAWLAPVAVMANTPEDALADLQNPQFNGRSMAIVESATPIPLATPSAQAPLSGGDARVTRYDPTQIEVNAAVQLNSVLVLGEKYYKGWHAYVDGKKAEIYPVDYVLRGVYLAPGQHKVEFVFDPTPFKVGKYLTLASFLIFAGALVREFLLRRRRTLGCRSSAEEGAA
ncbi:YfhO family protein [Geomonas sp. Red32]|uniref:YfhO family protein n=1 Tax=Geomonas sp. Red32 TaxID=2912856 RepID=UPI00202D033B|nr:YfhO family protein [Geomonas sp. Red32]MCM0084053.1 YfhO family protein [Geomonas sp. Red32]